jgi:hypothetical protein
VRLIRDLFSIRDVRTLAYGLASLAIGLMFIAAATMVIISLIATVPHLFVPIEMFTFIVAIGVDALVGNDVRRAVRL